MNRLQVRLSLALVLVLLLAMAFVSARTAERAETLLEPEIVHKAETAARSVAGLIDRALGLGIPPDRLVGLDDHLATIVDGGAGLARIAYVDAEGQVLYGAGTATDLQGVRLPLAAGPEAGQVVVDLDPAYAGGIVYKLWIDLAIVMVVTALVALELVYLGFGVGAYRVIEGVEVRLRAIQRGDLSRHPALDAGGTFGDLARRLDARLAEVGAAWRSWIERARASGDAARERALALLQQRHRLDETAAGGTATVVAVRAPLFVFMFAEELTRPFLPVYIQGLASPIAGLSPELVIGLPMMVFLAIVALAQPVLGTVTERAGRRRSMMTGAALGAAGYVATAFAADLLGLTLARALTAVGFAFVFVAAQGYVIDRTDMRQRARGMAVFVGAILVAGLCGPPIGGILADRIGMAATFAAAGVLAVASLALAALSLPRAPGHRSQARRLRLADLGAALGSPRLAALFFLCALPAKLALVAVAFFLVPLHMEGQGFDQAAIGRMLMIYPLAMVVLVPAFAALASTARRKMLMVTLGGLVAGAGTVLVPIDPGGLWAIAGMLLLLGLGQAMSITPQSALVGDFGAAVAAEVGESAVYGVFRLIERIGNALGPVAAGALLGLYGFSAAVLLIGAVVAVGALLFGITVAARGGSSDTHPAAEGNPA